jgi:NAD(P)-dependent dehydrogenase (short-subunit alcohol dehydrogenase family)
VKPVLDPNALAGKTVLVTGASRGVGAAVARALAAANANVVAHCRDRVDGAAEAVAALPEEQKLVLKADLRTPDACRTLWREAMAWRNGVDVLVLNAAVNLDTPVDGPDHVWDAAWAETMQVNVLGAGALMREAVRAFAERGEGTVIVLSSWAAQQGSRLVDISAYAASKAAIRNLAQTFARNYAHRGVKVHILAPGVLDTGMSTAGKDDAAIEATNRGLAMGRATGGDEVASVVAYLATGAAPGLTGSTLDINGASYIR